MKITQRLVEGFLFIFGGKVGAGLATLLITPLLVRLLGSSGYGDYAFALAVYSTLRTVSGGGIYEGARKFIAESPGGGRRSDIFGFYLQVAIIFGSTVFLLLVTVTHLFVGHVILDARLRQYLFLVAILVLLHPFFYLVRSSLMGYALEKYSESLIVLEKLFFGIVGLSLAYVGLHVAGVLIGHIVAIILVIVIGAVAVQLHTTIGLRSIDVSLPNPVDLYRARYFQYGMLTIVFVLLTKSLYNVDIILLQPFAGSEAVGYYRGALLFAEFLWFIPLALQIVLLHSTSRLWSEERIDEINSIASNITRYTLLLAGLLAIIIASIGDLLLPIYLGEEFIAAYIPLLLLLPGAIFFAVARPIYAIGQGHGDIKLLIYSTAGASSLNLVLNLLLIPPFGMYGAAVATSIGYGSMVIFHNWAANRMGFVPLRDIRLVRIALTCGAVFPIAWFLSTSIGSSLLTLTVVPPIAGGAFVGVALVTKAVKPSEIRAVTRTAMAR